MLVLTDMFGGTPSNLGLTFLEPDRVEVVTGVNLPMLIKLSSLRPVAADLLAVARELRETGRNAIHVASDLLPVRGEELRCVERAVTVRNALGMHARAAARFVHAAGAFQCRVTVTREDRAIASSTARASSGSCCSRPRGASTLRITADGADEDEALDALCRLVESGFGEAP